MQLIHKRLICQIMGAFVVLLTLSASFIFLDKVVNASGIDFGGDKSSVFVVIFVFLPIGSLAGLYLVDKLFFSFEGYNFGWHCIRVCSFLSDWGGVLASCS